MSSIPLEICLDLNVGMSNASGVFSPRQFTAGEFQQKPVPINKIAIAFGHRIPPISSEGGYFRLVDKFIVEVISRHVDLHSPLNLWEIPDGRTKDALTKHLKLIVADANQHIIRTLNELEGILLPGSLRLIGSVGGKQQGILKSGLDEIERLINVARRQKNIAKAQATQEYADPENHKQTDGAKPLELPSPLLGDYQSPAERIPAQGDMNLEGGITDAARHKVKAVRARVSDEMPSSVEDRASAVREYIAGVAVPEIAKKFGVDRNTIYGWAEKVEGALAKRAELFQTKKSDAVKEYREAVPVSEIVSKYGVDQKTVYRWAKEAVGSRQEREANFQRNKDAAVQEYIDGVPVADIAKKYGVVRDTIPLWANKVENSRRNREASIQLRKAAAALDKVVAKEAHHPLKREKTAIGCTINVSQRQLKKAAALEELAKGLPVKKVAEIVGLSPSAVYSYYVPNATGPEDFDLPPMKKEPEIQILRSPEQHRIERAGRESHSQNVANMADDNRAPLAAGSEITWGALTKATSLEGVPYKPTLNSYTPPATRKALEP